MTIINPNSISGISSITALNSTAAINLFKADGTSANIIAGVTTGANFITGTSNVHSTGYECTNINASGIITATSMDMISTDAGSSAAPEFKLYRNSASPADADYLGQIKFAGESDTGVERNYAKITGKILDASNGTEDGIIEFAHIKAGSQVITGRWRSDSLQLLNGTNLTVDGSVSATSFTGSGANLTSLPAQATIANNADNRVITGGSGVNLNGEANLTFDGSTLSVGGNISMGDSNRIYIGASNDAYIYHDTANTHFVNGTGHLLFRQTANSDVIIQSNNLDRFRIYNDGVVAIGQSSKSNTIGAGNLDIQGNATSCIIEMGNPFPTWQDGRVPEFRITSTNSTHTVDFETIWGGDNLLHKHLSFAGGNTDIWDGTYNNRIARFDGNGRLFLNGTTVSNTYDYLTVRKPASGFSELNMTVDANTSTSSAANAFIFTKSKHTYWSGYGFQSSHGHVGAIVGMRDSTHMNASQKIRIELGGTHINQSEVKTWEFQNDGDLSISGGNLKVADGYGVDFSSDGHVGGMTGELLDDYEEGTWTPTAHGYTGSNTSGNCFYTKVGRLVVATFRITWPNLTNSTSAEIRGLPFNCISQTVYTFGGAFSETNDNDNLSMIVKSGTSHMLILRCTSSGVDTQSISEVSGKDFRGTVSYFTNS